MRTIIFFDVDNTIYHNAKGEIPEQTKTLLKTLSLKENVVLGLATGRGLSKLSIIEEILPYFTYKVLVNGAYVLKNDEVILDMPLESSDIDEVLALIKNLELNVGMVGINSQAVNKWDKRVEIGLKTLRGVELDVNDHFHLNNKVYQLWMFADLETQLTEITKKIPKFRMFPWHQGGADFNHVDMNKSVGIKACLKDLEDYQLICIGDGANDVQMIEMADIGIVMGNSRFQNLIKKADHIAPRIDENQLHDFFRKLNLV